MKTFKEMLDEAVLTRKKHKGSRKKMKPADKKRAKKRKKAKKLLKIEPGGKFKLSIDPQTKKYIKVLKTPEERMRKIKTVQ